MKDVCGVCWGSHMCGLPARHDGDHVCSPDDPDAPVTTVPRDGRDLFLYQVDLLRYPDGDFCDLCGPVDTERYVNPLLDHAMRQHPKRWVEDGYAEQFSDYLGDGRWAERAG